MTVVFVHGVPDTPFMWTPLLEALDLPEGDVIAPALPGFAEPPPKGFPATKEAYADWLTVEVDRTVQRVGAPVDIVGHDWGALLTLRVASTRPDLIRSWAVTNALIDPDYRGHQAARIWATPVLGEVFMALSRGRDFGKALTDLGVPEPIAVHEAKFWQKPMRQCILSLYRSARGLVFRGDWVEDLKALPERGLVLWGENDPFVDLSVANRFRERHGFPLHVIKGTGHWGAIEKPEETAAVLKRFWAGEYTDQERDRALDP